MQGHLISKSFSPERVTIVKDVIKHIIMKIE